MTRQSEQSVGRDTDQPFHSTPRTWTVLVCAACFLLLTNGGRMGSADAFTQLQASVLLVRTGWVATDDPNPATYCWILGPDGRWYQAHDPGNTVLFIPAALVAGVAPGPDPVHQVPLPARVTAALSYALLGAALATVLYRVFSFIIPERAALACAALSTVGTPIWVYSRCTMDVLPACLGTGLTVWVIFSHASAQLPRRRATVLAGLSVVVTAWFRMSLLPFLAASTLAALVWNERERRWATTILFTSILVIGIAPVLGYNYIRTGHPLVLGTMVPKYAEQNGFAGHFGSGLYGLLISPNHGLFVFAPWLILGVIPTGLRETPNRLRRIVVLLLLGAAAYTVMIAGLRQWAKVEWGPRYLVPVLPILTLPAAAAAHRLWQSRWKPLVAVLAGFSVAVTLPAGIVNYSYVITEYPGAADATANGPYQLIGTYRALWLGLTGDQQEIPAALIGDPERIAGLRFPDLWTVRLIERGGLLQAVGVGITLVLVTVFVWSLKRLAQSPAARSSDLGLSERA